MSKTTTCVRNKKQYRREERKYNGCGKEEKNVKERKRSRSILLELLSCSILLPSIPQFHRKPRCLCETLQHFIGTLLEATVSKEGCGLYNFDKIWWMDPR